MAFQSNCLCKAAAEEYKSKSFITLLGQIQIKKLQVPECNAPFQLKRSTECPDAIHDTMDSCLDWEWIEVGDR